MEILFKALQGGRRYFAVRLNGRELFVGTVPECERYLEIHHRKVEDQRLDEKRPHRNRPFAVRTYRQVRAPA